jgi:hypothetical protein
MHKDFPVLTNHDVAVPETADTVVAALAEANADNNFALSTAGLDLGNLGTISVN